MIDDQNELIFVENPKTATFAIKCALYGDEHYKMPSVRVGTMNHDTPRVIAEKYPLEWSAYTKFVVVCNTWNRAHSFFDFYRRIANAESYQTVDFDAWVAAGCPPPAEDHLRAPMWGEGRMDDVLCQLRYCYDVDEIIVLHSFEHERRRKELVEGLERVCARIGIAVPTVPDRNRYGRTDRPISWKAETVKRLGNRYAEEIRRFGFQEPMSG